MKTSVNVASYCRNGRYPRQEQLIKMLESVVGQADVTRLWLNEAPCVPDWIPDGVSVAASKDDLCDLGKFAFLKPNMEREIYLTCDDDIAYPGKYVNDMVQAVKREQAIVTHHGRKLKADQRRYFNGAADIVVCLRSNYKEIELDVPGTGVMAFDTDQINPSAILISPDRGMVDLTFAVEAAKQGVPIQALPHDAAYLKYLEPPYEETLHYRGMQNQNRQIELMHEVIKLRGIT